MNNKIVKASDETSGGDVEIVNNDIYFYSEVTTASCLKLTKALRELDRKITIDGINNGTTAVIKLHINSDGGSMLSGFNVADQMKTMKNPIWTYAEGMVASAATFIYLAGHKRLIYKHSFLMVHQLSAGNWGTYTQFVDYQHFLDEAMEKIVNFYANHTRMEKNQIKKLLERDAYLNPSELIDLGFVDEII